jgi:hypothetical protein
MMWGLQRCAVSDRRRGGVRERCGRRQRCVRGGFRKFDNLRKDGFVGCTVLCLFNFDSLCSVINFVSACCASVWCFCGNW